MTDNRQLIIDAWRTFGTRDPERVGAVFAPDAQWLAPPDNATAMAIDGTSELHGRERIVRFITEEFQRVFVADVSWDVRGIYADGDHVVLEQHFEATLAGGGRYENDYCFVFVVRDGLIAEVREYMDTQRGAAWFRRAAMIRA
jgi:ketosteroid isomerase-like protein